MIFFLLDLQSESLEYQYFQCEKQKKGRASYRCAFVVFRMEEDQSEQSV